MATAMQELIEWLNVLYKQGFQTLMIPEIERKAEELMRTTERERIINDYNSGYANGYSDCCPLDEDEIQVIKGEDYYNQIIKTDNNGN